jgi:hypothetical protein
MAAEPTAVAMDVEAPAKPPSTAPSAKSRSPHDLLAETRASIEKVGARMLAIKRDGVPKSELRELVTQMSLLLVTLRQVRMLTLQNPSPHPLPKRPNPTSRSAVLTGFDLRRLTGRY